MSIAVSSLILFFLLIPGLAFRRTYFSEEFSKQYVKESFFGIFISSFVPSIFFHFFGFLIFGYYCNIIKLDVFFDILQSKPSLTSIENISESFNWILIYNVGLFVFSSISGAFLKNLVRTKKLDRKYKFLRYQNQWHYILTGEFFDFPRANIDLDKSSVEDIEFVFVDALIEVNGTSYLYDGILVDYELSNDGGLDFIIIKNAERRKLEADRELDDNGKRIDNIDSYYPISRHLLILKYSEIKNINFSYYKLEEEKGSFFPKLLS